MKHISVQKYRRKRIFNVLLLLLLLSRFSRVRLCATHRWQPTSLPRPWDSPGNNTGVGCHFLLRCMKVESEIEVAQSCLTLATPWTAAYQAPLSMGFSRQKYYKPEIKCLSRIPLPQKISSKNVHSIKMIQTSEKENNILEEACTIRDVQVSSSDIEKVHQVEIQVSTKE